MRKFMQNQSGFTLLELVVVLVSIAILACLVVLLHR
jgi:prepilin-type N-terminal cleavage/methylation domain-containing protein